MAQSQSIPESPNRVFQPPCPKCGMPMWLVNLSIFGDDRDLRTFECAVCQHTETAVVKFK